ncbi:hypothetical protein TKV_c12060 [Thermoanaerobacter kivui]|uniref:Alkaline shock response membrane anchor protein AmaP n=1 Tax=Thermoanaerobacter kivui TaxID=2325 RepID=A0A097ARE6_THEKI|nr:alkaline shock response membrane anchor protein AmaP [Thermoanaerobacter kivui]AIS52377.1 hypothetical protein TKV_c12060 [Thermoanaerobacter kivui]
MKLLSRFLLALFTFIVLVFSVLLIALSFGIINMDSITTVIKNLHGNWVYSILGVFLIIASLILLFDGTSKRSAIAGVTLTSKYGDINISYDTIISLAEKQVRKIDGVKSLNIYASKNQDKVQLTMNVTIAPDVIIPEIIQVVQKEIKEYIERNTSIYIENIKVNVVNTNSTVKMRVE